MEANELMLVGGVFFGVLCAFIAGQKNRSMLGWGLGGLLFGVFALIFLAFARALPERG